MALNYSHRPVSPAHISEDNLVSPLRILNGYFVEGVPEKNGEAYSIPWHMSRVEADERVFSCVRDRVDCCSSSEPTSEDIVDLLPSDPFEMDVRSTFASITEWLEDFEVDGGGYMSNNDEMDCQERYGFFDGWNVIWNNSFEFQPFPCAIHLNERLNTGLASFPSNLEVNEKPNACSDYFSSCHPFDQKLNADHSLSTHGNDSSMGAGLAPHEDGFRPVYTLGDVEFSRGNGSYMRSTGEVEGSSEFERLPLGVLPLILSYLGLKDILSLEGVCRFLLSAVRGDPLLWKTIHIDQPLNLRITDDALVQLTGRAQGKLECLSLIQCFNITADGLGRVLIANRRLTKLCVPECAKLGVQCITSYIRAYNSNNEFGGIKCVRISGLYGINRELFEELNLLLGSGSKKNARPRKPHFYHLGNFHLPLDDDRAIDIEMCPKCEKFKMVYDCPPEVCNVKDKASQDCRACSSCVGRCAVCGCCLNNTEYEETFYLEFMCMKCYIKQQQYCELMLAKKLSSWLKELFSTTCPEITMQDDIE